MRQRGWTRLIFFFFFSFFFFLFFLFCFFMRVLALAYELEAFISLARARAQSPTRGLSTCVRDALCESLYGVEQSLIVRFACSSNQDKSPCGETSGQVGSRVKPFDIRSSGVAGVLSPAAAHQHLPDALGRKEYKRCAAIAPTPWWLGIVRHDPALFAHWRWVRTFAFAELR